MIRCPMPAHLYITRALNIYYIRVYRPKRRCEFISRVLCSAKMRYRVFPAAPFGARLPCEGSTFNFSPFTVEIQEGKKAKRRSLPQSCGESPMYVCRKIGGSQQTENWTWRKSWRLNSLPRYFSSVLFRRMFPALFSTSSLYRPIFHRTIV